MQFVASHKAAFLVFSLLSTITIPVWAADKDHTFYVTTVEKDSSHPQYGVGGSMGYAINGKQDLVPVLIRGQTYEFIIDTGVAHDFYFSTQAKGWGMSALTKGVKGNFTYKGTVTITPTAETPNELYGGCRNHQFMGAPIKIVDAK